MAQHLRELHPDSAGIDIGSETLLVSFRGDAVKTYGTFTRDFSQLVLDLQSVNITTVAMEATGVYWYFLYKMLDVAGIEVYLVNGSHAKNVSGRKSDVSDCHGYRNCMALAYSLNP
jgi:transposase